jgi:uncharacterized protein with HEPN domain
MRVEPVTEKERWQRIQAAITRLRSHLAGRTKKDFLQDGVLSDAVLMQFSVIGEEVRYADPVVLAKHTYPWHQVRAFRNLIAHDYYGIHLPAVWAIVQDDLPKLEVMVSEIIRTEFS